MEIVSENSHNGEYTDKMAWYAQRGIPEYWIVDQAPGRPDDDAIILIAWPLPSGGKPVYRPRARSCFFPNWRRNIARRMCSD